MVPQNVTVNEWWFLAIIAAIFAYLGARRGLTVELYVLVAIIVGILFADVIARALEPWINLFYQMGEAIIRQRALSPDKLLATMFSQPRLITTALQRLYLGSAVFLLLVLIGYLLGRRRAAKAKPPRITGRLLAAMIGAVNGYLISFFLFPRHVSSVTTVVRVPSVDVRSLLQGQLFTPILVVVVAIITMGVLGAREGSRGKK